MEAIKSGYKTYPILIVLCVRCVRVGRGAYVCGCLVFGFCFFKDDFEVVFVTKS